MRATTFVPRSTSIRPASPLTFGTAIRPAMVTRRPDWTLRAVRRSAATTSARRVAVAPSIRAVTRTAFFGRLIRAVKRPRASAVRARAFAFAPRSSPSRAPESGAPSAPVTVPVTCSVEP